MAKSESKLDCLIIGHNGIEFGLVEERLKWTQRHSGSYHDLKANSINFHSRRITYMNLLNEQAPHLEIKRLPDRFTPYRTEIENLIGFFVNQLVLKVAVRPGETFKELLKRVREVERMSIRTYRSRNW